MARILFAINLITLVWSSAFASECVPSSESCSFYSCKENQMHCGEQGYLLHFGERLCQRYLDEQPTSSRALQKWYPKVRDCLEKAVDSLGGPLSCDELENRAFETHYGCYIETGFCNLSIGDQLKVLEIAGADALMPNSLLVSLQVALRCGR